MARLGNRTVTSPPHDETILALLHRAANAPYGIAVRSNNVASARAAFYRIRGETLDERLSRLTFRLAPGAQEEEIWIVLAPARRPASAGPTTLSDLGLSPLSSKEST